LLDALNTGPAAVRRLRYGRLWHRLQGALRPAQASSPPAPQSQALQDALDAHWQSACQQAQQSGGLDLRQRMEAARMLGLLGDTLRYVRADTPVQAPALGPGQADPAAGVRQPAPTQPRVPAGLRLHSSLWVDIGRMGQPTAFFIGSRHLVSHRSERPVRVVWLPGFQAASLPVTVAEWRQFVLCGGCADPEAPWWREAGPAAQGWLRDKRKGAGEQGWLPWFWDRSDHDEPLLPATGITLFEALAYARWAELLHQTEPAPRGFNSSQGRWQVRVPTELQWEAMARGPTTGPLWPTLAQTVVPTRSWAHRLWHVQPQALDFNHATTRWGRPSPVGVFSGSQTPLGLDDMAGNTWDWCCSALNEPTRLRGWRSPADCTLANTPAQADDDNAQRAWRGGSFRSIAGGCRAAVRSFSWPGKQDGAVGLRLVRTWVTGPGS
jgi:formylglycine-generating enzyme required for sulfatase activity